MDINKLMLGIAALTGTMMMTSCSSDEINQSGNAQESGSIYLTSRVAQTRSLDELQTDALNTATKVGAFGISGSAAVTNGNNNQYNVTSNGELEAVANDMKWPGGDAKVDIYAYAPYQSNWTYNSANSFSLSTDQSDDEGYLASDLLHASIANVSQTSSAVVLNFSHKLARINVTLTKGGSCTFDLSKSNVSIGGTKIGTTLNPSTGEVGAASGDVKDVKIGNEVNITTSGVTTYGVVVPQEMAVGTQFVKIVADGKLLSASLSNAVTLEAGKAYNFNAEIGASTEVTLTLGSVTLTDWGTGSDLQTGEIEEVEPEPITLTATFGTPGSNASYSAPTYTWTAGNSNLMTVFEFANGELANYHTLKFTISNLSEGAGVRMGYYVGNDFTEFGNGYYSEGEKTVDLTALGIDLSTVTKISFGGKSGSGGSCDILANDVILYGVEGGVPSSGDSSDGTLTATFGTPGGNASYDPTSYAYAWTGSTDNLMKVFEFSNGELANYATLEFTFSDLVDGPVRMGYYVGTTFTEIGTGYYNAGKKTVDLTQLGIDLSTVTKIAFGGRSNAGSCTIKASDVKLIPSN